MAKKCCVCKEELSVAKFIATNNPLLGGSLPICRDCVQEYIEKNKDDEWSAVDRLCQLADIPFMPEEFAKIWKADRNDAFGTYSSIFRQKQYEHLNWKPYQDLYIELQDRDKLSAVIPALDEDKRLERKAMWGPQYDDEQLEYLENLYAGIQNSVNIVNKMHEDQVKKACKLALIMEEKLRAGVEIDKDLKAYDTLCKSAGITTTEIKDGNDFNSWGEICAFLEKLGFKPTYARGANNDEVDKSMRIQQCWSRYMFINETGISDEIKERIEALKTADKLTNSGFDWEEYKEVATQFDDMEEDDFKVEV